tara:strand:+ start:326 stop:613 length:288 start_codon:yes stop_codon:yes gene_type:complete
MTALISLVPDGNFEVKDDDSVIAYRGVIPSDKKIDAEINRLQTEYDALQYQRDRQYPELGEQLDMLFRDMTAGKGDKTGEWYKAIAKVKSDNPKS